MKRLQKKMTEGNYWIGIQENIGMFSKSSLYKEEEAAEKDDERLLLYRYSRKYWHVQ